VPKRSKRLESFVETVKYQPRGCAGTRLPAGSLAAVKL
jgi:hypothetical protein